MNYALTGESSRTNARRNSVFAIVCCLFMLSAAAFADRPSMAQLQRSLLMAARPKVTELRRKFAGRVGVADANGMYIRAPECVIKDIESVRVQRGAGGSIIGLVTVSCIWKSPDQRTFQTPEDARNAEMTEVEPGKLRLTFAWSAGGWKYKGAKKA